MTAARSMEAWVPTGALRWNVPNSTTTRPPILEQEMRDRFTGETRWQSLPVFVDHSSQGARA